MIELPNQEQMQAMLMQQDQMQRAAVNQFVAETASRVFAALVAGSAGEAGWNSPKMATEKFRVLARRSRDAAPFLAEALGMMTIKERSSANTDIVS